MLLPCVFDCHRLRLGWTGRPAFLLQAIMPAKRKSVDGPGHAKQMRKAKSSASLEDAPRTQEVADVLDWLRKEVQPAGGPHRFLARRYRKAEELEEFACWLDAAFPADRRPGDNRW